MRRRVAIGVLAGVVAFGRLAGAAQPGKMPVVGILDIDNPSSFLADFRVGMRERGWVEGKNLRFEIRSAAGERARLKTLPEELVRLNVDVIVARLNLATSAAMAATRSIPIVMAGAGAPIETGLVASLAHPGGNLTGDTVTSAELGGKRLQLIRETLPRLARLAVLGNKNDPFTSPFLAGLIEGGTALGLAVEPILVSGADEFPAAFAKMARDHAGAVIMQASLPIEPMVELALAQRIAPFATTAAAAEAGALLVYTASWRQAYREAANYVDKILRGAKPDDLPIEEPTRFELLINLRTAKSLGLAVSPALLQQPDRIIE